MKRQLALAALFALVLIPDWVSACWPPSGGTVYGPVYYHPAPAPVCYVPPPVYCPPVVYLPPCAPVAAAPLHPPKVERSAPAAAAEPPKAVAQPNPPPPSRPPQVEPVRPAANLEPPTPKLPESPPEKEKPATPPPAPASPPPAPAAPPAAKIEFPTPPEKKGTAADPKLPPLVLPGEPLDPRLPPLGGARDTAPKLPPLELPKDGGTKLPPLELPNDGDAKSPPLGAPKTGGDLKLPPLEPPGGADAKVPELPGAPAVPVPAPAPDALIPPPGVSVPRNPDSLPPLTLPPDSPVSPDVGPTESKSSPLTGGRGPRVTVFPAAGAVAANGMRKVGFYNHTDRDLALTIEGRAVKLPAKTYLHAQLPPTFTWASGSGPATKQTVPADAGGVDVLFR